MKIDLKRAIEVLEACGYECEEIASTKQQRDELLIAAQEFIYDWDSCKSSGEWPVRSLGKLRAAISIMKGDAP